MENTLIKITTSSIIIEVNTMEHLKWTEADRLLRIETLEKALVICNDVLNDILENDFASRSYWKSQKSMIEKYLSICQIGTFKEGTSILNIETKESVFTPYSEPEILDDLEDAEPNHNNVGIWMIMFLVLFFLACILV